MQRSETGTDSQYEALLALLSLTDSALATGTFAHSFGLESMVTYGGVTASNLADFVSTWIEQQVAFDASFSLKAHRDVTYGVQVAPNIDVSTSLLSLNQTLDAFKLSRETRNASTKTGSRLLHLVAKVYRGENSALLTHPHTRESHQPIAFGIACALFAVAEIDCVLSLLQQNVTSMISAAQRLLPLGQMRAAEINWNLKPRLVTKAREIVSADFDAIVEAGTFAPQLETLSMTHPYQGVRLFLS